MRASDLASDRFYSKRILYFANLIFFPVSRSQSAQNRVCVLSNSIALKVTEYFQNRAKNNYSDRTETALNKKVLKNSKIADTVLFFVCYTKFPPNLDSVAQIPFEL